MSTPPAAGIERGRGYRGRGPCLVTWTAAAALVLSACGGPTPFVDDPRSQAIAPECAEVDRLAVQPPEGAEPTGTTAEPIEDVPLSDPEPHPEEGERDDPGAPEGREHLELGPQIEQWGLQEAAESYAGLWIDQDLGGFVVAFASDVDAHAEEVRERFHPGLAVAEAATPYAELRDIQERIGQDDLDIDHNASGAIRSIGVDVMHNRTSVGIFDPTQERLAELSETYGAEALCFEIEDPPESPDEAVSALAKAGGWRDGLGEVGFALLEVAYDRETAERAWADNVPADLEPRDDDLPAEPGAYGDLADVDFDRQAVVVWSAGQSGSCPGWLADIRKEGDTVHIERGQTAQACTDDFNPYRMVLAVDLDRLPAEEDLPHRSVEGLHDGEIVAYPDAGE